VIKYNKNVLYLCVKPFTIYFPFLVVYNYNGFIFRYRLDSWKTKLQIWEVPCECTRWSNQQSNVDFFSFLFEEQSNVDCNLVWVFIYIPIEIMMKITWKMWIHMWIPLFMWDDPLPSTPHEKNTQRLWYTIILILKRISWMYSNYGHVFKCYFY